MSSHADHIAIHHAMLKWSVLNARYQTTFWVNNELRGANGSLLEVLRWLRDQGWANCVHPNNKFQLTMDENQAFMFRMRWA